LTIGQRTTAAWDGAALKLSQKTWIMAAALGIFTVCTAMLEPRLTRNWNDRPDAAAMTPDLNGIPDTSIAYYDVSGTDAPSLRASLNALGPRDGHDHLHVDALSTWRISWFWPTAADGTCDLSQAEVRFAATVLLPRIAAGSALHPVLAREWQDYLAALKLHEAGHVRHAYEHSGDVAAAIRDSTCKDAGSAAQAVIKDLVRFDIAYDAATRHGATQGAVFPRS
jgi:predicted secreted Zn-dependent protease